MNGNIFPSHKWNLKAKVVISYNNQVKQIVEQGCDFSTKQVECYEFLGVALKPHVIFPKSLFKTLLYGDRIPE